MSGRLHFSVPHGMHGEGLADALANQVRRVGKKKGIKIPKAIQMFGVGNHEFTICHTSNAMRDLILAEAATAMIPRRLYDPITERWYVIAEDPYVPSC